MEESNSRPVRYESTCLTTTSRHQLNMNSYYYSIPLFPSNLYSAVALRDLENFVLHSSPEDKRKTKFKYYKKMVPEHITDSAFEKKNNGMKISCRDKNKNIVYFIDGFTYLHRWI